MKPINSILIFLFPSIISSCVNLGAYQNVDYQVIQKDDGGYTVNIKGYTQIVAPITAEGSFPKQQLNYQIELVGDGKEWTYRNQPGFYFSFPKDIHCKREPGEIGYAWVDINKEYIYLNFYWIQAPDSLIESRLNGKYKIKK